MHERALLVDGQLTIGPRIGGGTEVRLLVPVRSRTSEVER
jgi:signal transduction histidine kinase